MDVLIVGAGAVGRWFGELVGPDAEIAFADLDPAAAEDAAESLDRRARVVPLDGEESFGLVCIAVPLAVVGDAVERHAPRAQRAVVDVTGVMAEPLSVMAAAAPARERLSLHPLFAPEHGPGTVAVASGAPGPATDQIRRWLESAGNDLVDVDPAEHDQAMETVQGRAHAAILAFALAADDVPPELATPIYNSLSELAERVTDGEARVYADIQDRFGGAEEIADAAERIAGANREEFEDLYENAG